MTLIVNFLADELHYVFADDIHAVINVFAAVEINVSAVLVIFFEKAHRCSRYCFNQIIAFSDKTARSAKPCLSLERIFICHFCALCKDVHYHSGAYHLLLFERIVFTLLHQCQFQDNDIIADVTLKAIHFVSDFTRLVYCEASEEVLAEIRERGSESFAKLEQPERCRNCHDVLAIDLIRSVHYQIRKEDSAVLLIFGSQLLAAISEPLLHKFNSNHNSNS